jgi:cytosine/creatinine deaminase
MADLDWAFINASLPNRPGRWCIGVAGETIATVVEGDRFSAQRVWDVEGNLLVPGLIDAHTHLDKALTAERSGDVFAKGGLAAAIQTIRRLKQNFDAADVSRRATQALQWSLAAGVTRVRTNVEADPFLQLQAVDGLLAVQQAIADKLDLQLVAFPQEGWFHTAGTLEAGCAPWIEQALQRGVRILGGNVNRGLWTSSPEAQVDELLQLALTYDCDLDLHLDNWDGAEAFTLPYLAQKTIAQGWQGRVTVAHIASLSYVSEAEAESTVELLKQAEITVAVLPTRIQLTRVAMLLEAGINVVCGTDNLRDPFVRYGQADPIAAVLLLAQLLRYLSNRELETLWQTISVNPARMMRLPQYGIAPGYPADLVILQATSISDAILHQSDRLAVFKRGQLVAGLHAAIHTP